MSSEQPVDVDGLRERWQIKVDTYSGYKDGSDLAYNGMLETLNALTRLKAAEAEVESYQQILADRVGPDIAAINALEAENAALQSRLTVLVEATGALPDECINAENQLWGIKGAGMAKRTIKGIGDCINKALRAAAEGGEA